MLLYVEGGWNDNEECFGNALTESDAGADYTNREHRLRTSGDSSSP